MSRTYLAASTNRGSSPVTPQAVLSDRFAAVVSAHADRTAVHTGQALITYAELGRQVAQRSDRIGGADDPRPLAVRLDGSGEAVAALIAALLSGRPVVPVDAALPSERVRAMVGAVHARAFPGCDLPGCDLPAAATAAGPPPPTVRIPPSCLVIAFTSGSTGRPKAVLHPAALWLNQIEELGEELGLGPDHRAAQALPVGYGGGLDITLAALFNGATLHLVEPRLDGVDAAVQALRHHAPDSLHLSPALLRAICGAPDAHAALHAVGVVATCGETVHSADVRALRALAPSATFINRSGSSETGNLTFNVVPPACPLPDGMLSAGRPARHKQIRIVDDAGTTLPDGEIGHVHVTSAHIASGYVVDGRVELFESAADGRRDHRLGDRGRFHDGELHLVGRTDDTIKIRGYRVDIAEITSAAMAVAGIDDAVVTITTTRGRPEIVAHLAPTPGRRPPAVADVRAALGTVLPTWMQPTHLIMVAALPRTSNGKVDRTALPDPVDRAPRVAPRSVTEGLLAPIWADLLSVSDIGADDDFTSLGGDSLTAVELIRRIEDTFGVRISPSTVVSAGTLAALATRIDGQADHAGAGVVAELPSVDDNLIRSAGRPLVFAFAGAGEAALAFAPLSRRMRGYRVIGLQAHALERRGLPDWTITRAARRCVDHITAIDPTGPYQFVGHSLGGVIAMEAARILARSGREVSHIVCLDTILTGPLGTRSSVALTDCTASAAHAAQSRAPARRTELWRTRMALLTAGWWRRPTEAQWALFHELGRRSAMLHRLRPYPGALTAVLAEDNPDLAEWWYSVAPECRAVHRVGGDHNGMLRSPHVDRTADLVRSALSGVPV